MARAGATPHRDMWWQHSQNRAISTKRKPGSVSDLLAKFTQSRVCQCEPRTGGELCGEGTPGGLNGRCLPAGPPARNRGPCPRGELWLKSCPCQGIVPTWQGWRARRAVLVQYAQRCRLLGKTVEQQCVVCKPRPRSGRVVTVLTEAAGALGDGVDGDMVQIQVTKKLEVSLQSRWGEKEECLQTSPNKDVLQWAAGISGLVKETVKVHGESARTWPNCGGATPGLLRLPFLGAGISLRAWVDLSLQTGGALGSISPRCGGSVTERPGRLGLCAQCLEERTRRVFLPSCCRMLRYPQGFCAWWIGQLFQSCCWTCFVLAGCR